MKSLAPRGSIAFLAIVFVGLLQGVSGAADTSEPRTKTRLLYGFENPREIAELRGRTEGMELDVVQDNGVTEGQNCARVTVKKGAAYGVVELGREAIRDWSDFDYFAIDVYADDEHAYPLNLELWDAASKNYATRCTYEDQRTHRGRQTFLYRIARARRNGKEGRDWEELEPQDKIDRRGLVRVKLFTTPRNDRDAVLWIDNLRLLQEDAAKPKLRVPLPDGALAFDFGSPGAVAPGFRGVSAQSEFAPGGAGFASTQGLQHAGEGWPDLLSGTFVLGGDGQTLDFRATVPDGDYLVWLAAGPIIRPDLKSRRFLLQVNDQTVLDDAPTDAEFFGEKYLYRFLRTQYSQRPNAVWLDYIDRMYPSHVLRVRVSDGQLRLTAANHFLAALVALPASRRAEFDTFVAAVRDKRIEAFQQATFAAPTFATQPPDKPACLWWLPDETTDVRPNSTPTDSERTKQTLSCSAAPGQRVVLRLAATPFQDFGPSRLTLSDLRGPATIAAGQVRGHFRNFRFAARHVPEMVLLPSLTPRLEAGVTTEFWLWLHVPADAKPGVYRGQYTFQAGAAGPKFDTPVELTVLPIKLRTDLAGAYGMYFHERHSPPFPTAERRRLLGEQFAWMREVGFTSVGVGGPTVVGLKSPNQVTLRFDRLPYEVAAEAGLAQRPEQMLMGTSLGVARAIGRRLPGSQGAKVDQQPGIELRQPEFRGYHLDALRQYRDFIASTKLPVALELVDEPRETPNPWNRNLADTIAYAKLMHEVPGLTGFVTPMSDGNSGQDYTVLADHLDIVSIHAWKPSRGLLTRTREQGKRLWLYNTGMDRFSWGFYNWRVGSTGRWEWHFCFAEDQAFGGYPGREWYNPFTSLHGMAPNAPDTFRGGMLYQSAFLRVSEGLTDLAYLETLQHVLRTGQFAGSPFAGDQAAAAREAEQFLTALRTAIPELPELKGLASAEAGALIGLGVNDDSRRHLGAWREKIAGLLVRLSK